MKKIGLLLIGLFIATNVYAVDITVTLTQVQFDALSVVTSSPQQWVQDAATNKANSMIERLVLKHSDKQPGKITDQAKTEIINTIDLVKERDERRGNR